MEGDEVGAGEDDELRGVDIPGFPGWKYLELWYRGGKMKRLPCKLVAVYRRNDGEFFEKPVNEYWIGQVVEDMDHYKVDKGDVEWFMQALASRFALYGAIEAADEKDTWVVGVLHALKILEWEEYGS